MRKLREKLAQFGSWVKRKWDEFKGWLDRGVTRVGGPRETQNLLGFGLRFVGGTITLPFRIVGAGGKAGWLLMSNPKEGVLYMRFLGWRTISSLAALIGINRVWHPPTKYREGYWEVQGKRAVGFLWTQVICFIIAGPLLEAGLVTAGLIFMFGPLAVWVMSGLRPMVIRWRALTYEDWATKIEAEAQTEKTKVMQERKRATKALVEGRSTLEQHTADLEQMRVEQERAQMDARNAQLELKTREAELKAREAELEAKALQLELNEQGGGYGAISQMANRLSSEGPKTMKAPDVEVLEDPESLRMRELASKIRNGEMTDDEAREAIDLGMRVIKNVTTGKWELSK